MVLRRIQHYSYRKQKRSPVINLCLSARWQSVMCISISSGGFRCFDFSVH